MFIFQITEEKLLCSNKISSFSQLYLRLGKWEIQASASGGFQRCHGEGFEICPDSQWYLGYLPNIDKSPLPTWRPNCTLLQFIYWKKFFFVAPKGSNVFGLFKVFKNTYQIRNMNTRSSKTKTFAQFQFFGGATTSRSRDWQLLLFPSSLRRKNIYLKNLLEYCD